MSCSMCLARLIAHHGNEQIGNAGPAYLAKWRELLTIDTTEQQDAAPECLPLVNRLESPRSGDLFGLHHHFQIPQLKFVHAAAEYDAPAIDEHHISENVLDFVDLMSRHHDGAAAIEVVVQQRIVELLAIQD